MMHATSNTKQVFALKEGCGFFAASQALQLISWGTAVTLCKLLVVLIEGHDLCWRQQGEVLSEMCETDILGGLIVFLLVVVSLAITSAGVIESFFQQDGIRLIL